MKFKTGTIAHATLGQVCKTLEKNSIGRWEIKEMDGNGNGFWSVADSIEEDFFLNYLNGYRYKFEYNNRFL